MECNRIIHSFSSSDRFCVVGISKKGPHVIRSLVRKSRNKEYVHFQHCLREHVNDYPTLTDYIIFRVNRDLAF